MLYAHTRFIVVSPRMVMLYIYIYIYIRSLGTHRGPQGVPFARRGDPIGNTIGHGFHFHIIVVVVVVVVIFHTNIAVLIEPHEAPCRGVTIVQGLRSIGKDPIEPMVGIGRAAPQSSQVPLLLRILWSIAMHAIGTSSSRLEFDSVLYAHPMIMFLI
jgi:hypothetical protein